MTSLSHRKLRTTVWSRISDEMRRSGVAVFRMTRQLRWIGAVGLAGCLVTSGMLSAAEPVRIGTTQGANISVSESAGRQGSVLRWGKTAAEVPVSSVELNPAEMAEFLNVVQPVSYQQPVSAPNMVSTLGMGGYAANQIPQIAMNQESLPDIAQGTPKYPTAAPAPIAGVVTPPNGEQFNADICPDAAQEAPISTSILDRIAINEQVPVVCPMTDQGFEGRCWDRTCYHWTASALCSKPIYFVDNNLERYGQSNGPFIQPFVSAGHFLVSVPMLPYAMGLYPPNECIYALGDYRPGSYAPKYLEPLPISLRAVAAEGVAVGGAIAIMP